jgi:hypothetical protein
MKLCQKVFHQLEQEKKCLGEQINKVYFVEALDGGDQSKKNSETKFLLGMHLFLNLNLYENQTKICGIQFGNEENAVVMDSWYDTRSQKTYFLNPKTGENKEIAERNYQDVYADPGNFQTDKNEFGQYVISIKNGKAHLIGDGFTKDGQFPFIDEFDFKNFQTKIIHF